MRSRGAALAGCFRNTHSSHFYRRLTMPRFIILTNLENNNDMRTIKFRAFHNGAKEMLYENRVGDVFKWYQEHQDIEIMQFTGLTDRNGKEIYEGDIVKLHAGHYLNAIVSWFDSLTWDSGGSSHPGFYCKEWIEFDELNYICGFYDTIVIGNIYEHPELIQEFDEN